ncbi:hypothetical protein F5148DRAFT_1282144 [Russula earlei]|uniref:Uncharacterized protein n=1 Tax=Russula earlei TaxID=71964 RepID=A0ACC0UF42_9AGAM|nr:hypothetical protein F5148DRAFT_1282144 [Russula earlei]
MYKCLSLHLDYHVVFTTAVKILLQSPGDIWWEQEIGPPDQDPQGLDDNWFYSAPAKTFEPEGAWLPELWESPQSSIASAIAAVPSPSPTLPPSSGPTCHHHHLCISHHHHCHHLCTLSLHTCLSTASPFPSLLPVLPTEAVALIVPVLPAVTTAPAPTTATSLLASAYPAVIFALSIAPAISAASVSLTVLATISVPAAPGATAQIADQVTPLACSRLVEIDTGS